MRTLDTKTILAIQDSVANGNMTVDQALQLLKTLTK